MFSASVSVIDRDITRSRFQGCLLGGAVGDALGAPVEFLSLAEIRERFGKDGITDYAPAYGGIGTITDDTQMTLFTAEGLLRAWVRGASRGIGSVPGVVSRAYLRWLLTQGIQPAFQRDVLSDKPGWLYQQAALHSRRAPGNTCLSALEAMLKLGEPARNDSKGCGGVMRVAPAGLFVWRRAGQRSPQDAFDLGTALAALTHGHPSGSLTGGVLAVLIRELADGAALPAALSSAKTCLSAQPDHEQTLLAIIHAEALAVSGVAHDDAIARLGEGWVAEEALAISVYCALVARDFRHGVVLAVNHDGDSDSTGAITGNLLGALLGVEAIPPEWLAPLELREVITELADDLSVFPEWDVGIDSADEELVQRIWTKYPGC
ncbi:ADP-ribosylglycohydrolase family protein [Cupriavidus sp. D39]|uniref:ADP-ribosylglycohydrolase family protein n=1 Tax=Cupriavidus sp. D39 TaxID=2997877 RepID=UPI00226DE929|nr:ADP-ribosylglycohydrolase family protein [Cupriavidus sp. D39]MCY0857163.1 ADP-ribosylglycohydrolase family protein [Cupriavidus sp. D39]